MPNRQLRSFRTEHRSCVLTNRSSGRVIDKAPSPIVGARRSAQPLCDSRRVGVKFVMIYGPSGIGKESVGRELAKRNGWHIFPQHLAFDISCAVVGFGNNGFEKYQRKICLDAFRTLIEKNVSGIVFTFCYVSPASNY